MNSVLVETEDVSTEIKDMVEMVENIKLNINIYDEIVKRKINLNSI